MGSSAAPTQIIKPLQVLLVDDDDLFLAVTEYELTELGCAVTAVGSPELALEILRDRDFDAVITDWQMPVMDGIELVRRARQQGSSDKFRYVVLTTARPEAGTVRAALEAGADGVLFKPLDRLQLELTIASIRRTVGFQRRLQRRNHHLANANRRTREAYLRIKADISAAAALHRSLLPRPQPHDRVDFDWSYMPAQSLGGDTIGLVTLKSGATLFFVADVRGHGVPASLASFHVHHRLIQLSPEDPQALVAAINQLNDEISEQPDDTYCTLLCGLVNPECTGGWVIRAGHPQPLLVTSKSVTVLEVEGNFPLGWFPGQNYSAQSFALPHGSCLLIYSDGVTECTDIGGAPVDGAGLKKLIKEAGTATPTTLIAHLEAELLARRGRSGFEDDVSILGLSRRQFEENCN